MVVITAATAEQTWALRHKVLRPHQSLSDCQFPGDHLASSLHFVARRDDVVVGTASVYNEAEPGSPNPRAWRLRGMATDPEVRGQGFGGRLLEAVTQAVAERDGDVIWANARTGVSGFYARYGFVTVSAPFDIPDIGAHVLIRRETRLPETGNFSKPARA